MKKAGRIKSREKSLLKNENDLLFSNLFYRIVSGKHLFFFKKFRKKEIPVEVEKTQMNDSLREDQVLNVMGQGTEMEKIDIQKAITKHFSYIGPIQLIRVLKSLEEKSVLKKKEGRYIIPL